MHPVCGCPIESLGLAAALEHSAESTESSEQVREEKRDRQSDSRRKIGVFHPVKADTSLLVSACEVDV